jgi:hypothetical protein
MNTERSIAIGKITQREILWTFRGLVEFSCTVVLYYSGVFREEEAYITSNDIVDNLLRLLKGFDE